MILRWKQNLLINFRRFLSNRIILGIETSCDDTGVAIITENGKILSDICVSQTELHISNGGIIPPVARDKHRAVIDKCVSESLEISGLRASELDAIAVTTMPGLPLSLGIGCVYAKKLSSKYDLPVIPIHHMQAHALTAMMQYKELQFPFVTLLISGGHCIIAYVNSVEDFRLLGTSIDIAPGDILDKTARQLKLKNLGEPFNKISGGAAIEIIAKNGNPFSFFTKATENPLFSRTRTCNFSFSGFSTSIKYQIERLEKEQNISPDEILPEAPDISASILYVLSFNLIRRLQRAFQYLDYESILPENGSIARRLVISGGCASNKFLRNMIKQYCDEYNIQIFIPSQHLCTDNGLMIAWNGALKLNNSSSCVLRDQNHIQSLYYQSKALIGVDLTSHVTQANIKLIV